MSPDTDKPGGLGGLGGCKIRKATLAPPSASSAFGQPGISSRSSSMGGSFSPGAGPSSSGLLPVAAGGAGVCSGGLALAASSAVGAASAPTQSSGVQNPPRFDEDVEMPLIKVVVLGASGVGKTALVKRFVSNDFPTEHVASKKKAEYFPSLILNDSLFELKVSDLPAISHFPRTPDAEWSDFRFLGLRSASAYLFVYDASDPAATFDVVRTLREQMLESRDMTNVPVIVAANKMDCVTTADAVAIRERKDIVHLVKKTWRASHVECSAKHNWNVVAVFKELAVTLDMIANGQVIGGAQQETRKKRCLMF